MPRACANVFLGISDPTKTAESEAKRVDDESVSDMHEKPPEIPRHHDWLCGVLLLGVSIALWAPRFSGPIDLRYDAGVYYIGGTSIYEGKGYRLLNEPGEVRAVQYPPLLPAIVAAHQWALGTSDPVMVAPALRITYFVFFTAYLLAVFALARKFLRPLASLGVALITALYIQTWFLSDLLFAEVPFALAAVAFALSNRRSDRPSGFILTALIGAAALMLRTAGITVLAAWCFEALAQRRWKQLGLRVAASLIPVLAWQAYVWGITSSTEYTQPAYEYQRAPYQYSNVTYAENIILVDPFAPELGRISAGGMAKRIGENTLIMPRAMGEATSSGVGFVEHLIRRLQTRLGVSLIANSTAASIYLAMLGTCVIAGLILLMRRGEWFIPAYVGATAAIICITPWPGQFMRYFAPATPFLALGLIYLLWQFVEWSRKRQSRWVVSGATALSVILPLLILGIQIRHAVEIYSKRSGRAADAHRMFFYEAGWPEFDDSLDWLKARVEPADIVVNSSPHWTYLKTGAKSVMIPMERDPVEAQRLIGNTGARYLIVDSSSGPGTYISEFASAAVEKHPDRWRIVYENAGTKIYERVAPSTKESQ